MSALPPPYSPPYNPNYDPGYATNSNYDYQPGIPGGPNDIKQQEGQTHNNVNFHLDNNVNNNNNNNKIANPLEELRGLCARYEISDYFANKIRQLEGFEIVLICDDSGSMNTPVASGGAAVSDPFAKRNSRWDELKQTVTIVTDIACLLDRDGLDIYFLNRPALRNVKDKQTIANAFSQPPAGWTPIARTLRTVLREKAQVLSEKKLLIIIATDGEPTNETTNQVDTATLKHILKHERKPMERIFVSFLACTDDDEVMKYLDDWDGSIPNLDVVDDYASERAQIIKAQGNKFKFTYSDYVVKLLLGAIDPEIDKLDETKGGCIVS